jgi:hypothetical protein
MGGPSSPVTRIPDSGEYSIQATAELRAKHTAFALFRTTLELSGDPALNILCCRQRLDATKVKG